jgi:hypothetical protein
MKNIRMQAKEGKVVDLRFHIMSITSNIYAFFSACSSLQWICPFVLYIISILPGCSFENEDSSGVPFSKIAFGLHPFFLQNKIK